MAAPPMRQGFAVEACRLAAAIRVRGSRNFPGGSAGHYAGSVLSAVGFFQQVADSRKSLLRDPSIFVWLGWGGTLRVRTGGQLYNQAVHKIANWPAAIAKGLGAKWTAKLFSFVWAVRHAWKYFQRRAGFCEWLRKSPCRPAPCLRKDGTACRPPGAVLRPRAVIRESCRGARQARVIVKMKHIWWPARFVVFCSGGANDVYSQVGQRRGACADLRHSPWLPALRVQVVGLARRWSMNGKTARIVFGS